MAHKMPSPEGVKRILTIIASVRGLWVSVLDFQEFDKAI